MDLENLQSLEDTDRTRAEEIMSKLLSNWSIPRGKSMESRMDYEFIIKNEGYFSTLLALCGYQLKIPQAVGEEVAYIESESVINRRKFNKQESIVILRLLKYYFESRTKVTLAGGDSDITVEDLLTAVNATSKSPMDLKELKSIAYTLDGYNLIRIDEKKKVDFGPDTIISIMAGLPRVLPYATMESVDEKLQAYMNESTRKKKSDSGDAPEEMESDLDDVGQGEG